MERKSCIPRDFRRLGVQVALAVALLIGCGGGGGGYGSPESNPPTVVSGSPADGEVEVAVDASLRITFSEPMDPATVNGTTVKVRVGVTDVAGTVNCVNNTLIFTPAANWDFSSTYTVTISGGPSGIKDMAGNFMSGDCTCTFSTGQAPDTNPPNVTGTNPADGATGIPVGTTVTAVFSEPVTNVTQASFLLTASGTQVPGEVMVNGATATFTPSAPLSYGTAYTATVTTGVADLSGNPLRADVNWTFTTQDGSSKAVINIAGGPLFSVLLKTDGTVWAWGNNGSGALGDGTTIDRYAPVLVSGL